MIWVALGAKQLEQLKSPDTYPEAHEAKAALEGLGWDHP